MKRILLCLALVACSAISLAQLRQLNNAVTGEGRVIVGNHTNEKVDRATVDLRSNGDFTMTLQGNSRWQVAGRWRLAGANRCELDIEEAIGDSNASGSGTVWLENMNTVREISINGRAMRDNLIVTFTARGGGGGGGNWSSIDMNQSRFGGGSYTSASGRTDNIHKVSVVLRRDGTAVITAYGDRTYVFSGHQTSADDRVIDVQIDRAEGDFNADGRGYISRDGKVTFSRVEIAGRNGNRRYNLQFSAVGGGGSGGGDLPTFNDRAQGNGNLRRDRSRDTFGQVDVDCRRDGTFEMRVFADRTEVITGTWRSSNRNLISIEVNRAFGTSANGRGSIRVSNSRNVDRIDLAGSTGRTTYSLDFSAGDKPDGFNGLNVSSSGRGWLQWPNQQDRRITSMRVYLRPNGQAEITINGSPTIVFMGEWYDFDARRHTVSLRIKSRTGFGSITGAGSVTLDNGNKRPRRVEFDGRTGGRNYSVSFDAN